MSSIDRLLAIMERLRDPAQGCPWDCEQSFSTIAPYTLEEAFEVDHAIRQGDMEGLCEELGDLLLQVVYHAQMAREAEHFDFDRVVMGICEKLVRRHPHVFGDQRIASVEEQNHAWEQHKRRERAAKAASRDQPDEPRGGGDPFEGIPLALPALARAAKLQKRAAGVQISDPAREQSRKAATTALDQIRRAREGAAAATGQAPVDEQRVTTSDVGALLFACVHLAQSLGIDAEQALRDANAGFQERVRHRFADEAGEF